MTRLIRFKAWDTLRNEMWHHYNFPDEYLMDLTGTIWDTKAHCPIGTGLGMPVNNRFIMLQSTGLCDKNGNEIFEGDIVKENDGRSTGIIEWFHGGLVSKNEHGRRMHIGMFLPENLSDLENSNVNFLEIIGNIYTHPQLIQTNEAI